MSSKKRRIKRKIDMLCRMDDTRSRMFDSPTIAALCGSTPAMRYWETCMMPLGRKLARMGHAERAQQNLQDNREDRVYYGGRP